MNRVLQFLGECCPCRARQRHIERCRAAAESIEELLIEDAVEIVIPCADRIADEGMVGPRVWVCFESDYLAVDNLAADVAVELRSIVRELVAVAERLEGGQN